MSPNSRITAVAMLLFSGSAFAAHTVAEQMPAFQVNWDNYQAKLNEAIGISTSGRTIGGFRRGSYGDRSPYYPLYRSGG